MSVDEDMGVGASHGAPAVTPARPRAARPVARGLLGDSDRPTRARGVVGYLALALITLPFLAPIYWLVTGVFKPTSELVHVPPVWVPHPWVLSNLGQLFATQGGNLLRYAGNTLYICVFTVVATLVASSLAAYGFSQFEFKGRDALFWTVILTLILPAWATIVPQYQLFSWLHWVGSLKPLTMPYLAGDPFSVFLLRQYMLTVPSDYFEAARIDGAGELRIFYQIMVPMVKPALVVAGVFAFINSYNSFFSPLVYLTKPKDYTLALGAYQFVEVHGSPDMAGIVAYTALVVAPLVILFLVAQRQIIRGVQLTGLR